MTWATIINKTWLIKYAPKHLHMAGFIVTWHSTWHWGNISNLIFPSSLKVYSGSMNGWMHKKDDSNTEKCQFKPIQKNLIGETEAKVASILYTNSMAFCFKWFSLWSLGMGVFSLAMLTSITGKLVTSS